MSASGEINDQQKGEKEAEHEQSGLLDLFRGRTERVKVVEGLN